MNLSNLLKNKFVLAIPLSIILVGCLYKYNEFTKITNEKEGKEVKTKDLKYYIKFFLIFYLVSLVFIMLLIKGYEKLTNRDNSSISALQNTIEDTFKTVKSKQEITNIEKEQNKEQKNSVEQRNNQLNNDIIDLDMDVDTSELESISIESNNMNKQKDDLVKKQNLINKRKQLLELKKKRMNKKVEAINTGTPDF